MPMNEKEYKEMIGLLNELETMLENPQADGIDFEKMFGQIGGKRSCKFFNLFFG